jgi:hypothetical protein
MHATARLLEAATSPFQCVLAGHGGAALYPGEVEDVAVPLSVLPSGALDGGLAFLHSLGPSASEFLVRKGPSFLTDILDPALRDALRVTPDLYIPNNVFMALRECIRSFSAGDDAEVHANDLTMFEDLPALYARDPDLASRTFQWRVLLQMVDEPFNPAEEECVIPPAMLVPTASNARHAANILHALHGRVTDVSTPQFGTPAETMVVAMYRAYTQGHVQALVLDVLVRAMVQPVQQELEATDAWTYPLHSLMLLTMDDSAGLTAAIVRYFVHRHKGSLVLLVNALRKGIKLRRALQDPAISVSPWIVVVYELWLGARIFGVPDYAFLGTLIKDSMCTFDDSVVCSDEQVVVAAIMDCLDHSRLFFDPPAAVPSFDHRSRYSAGEMEVISGLSREERVQDLVNILAYGRRNAQQLLTVPALLHQAAAMGYPEPEVHALAGVLQEAPWPAPDAHVTKRVRIRRSAKAVVHTLAERQVQHRKDRMLSKAPFQHGRVSSAHRAHRAHVHRMQDPGFARAPVDALEDLFSMMSMDVGAGFGAGASAGAGAGAGNVSLQLHSDSEGASSDDDGSDG